MARACADIMVVVAMMMVAMMLVTMMLVIIMIIMIVMIVILGMVHAVARACASARLYIACLCAWHACVACAPHPIHAREKLSKQQQKDEEGHQDRRDADEPESDDDEPVSKHDCMCA